MRYTECGKVYDIDNQKLKSNLETYHKSFETLSKMLKNANVVGTYSEVLVCSVLGLDKELDSHSCTDAKGLDGKTYQIKSRWGKSFLEAQRGQNEFGSITYCKGKYPFNFLILVYYEESLLNPKVFKIESKNINSLFKRGAYLKKTLKKGNNEDNGRVVFRYNNAFKQAVKDASYICDISSI